jgi:hypothetical protein
MTMHLLFDKLAYVDRLKASGVDERQARAHADGLEQAFREEVATKSDLAAFSAHIDTRFAQIDTRFAQIDTRFAQIDTKFAAVQTDIQKSQNRILLTIITVAFALLGALKYLP